MTESGMLCKLEQKALLTIKYKKHKTQTNYFCFFVLKIEQAFNGIDGNCING